jgi:hypothetical protein
MGVEVSFVSKPKYNTGFFLAFAAKYFAWAENTWRVWFQNAINPFLCIREKCKVWNLLGNATETFYILAHKIKMVWAIRLQFGRLIVLY